MVLERLLIFFFFFLCDCWGVCGGEVVEETVSAWVSDVEAGGLGLGSALADDVEAGGGAVSFREGETEMDELSGVTEAGRDSVK
ncbi:hypothetical protein ACB092_07G013000 [Castanea dentata]